MANPFNQHSIPQPNNNLKNIYQMFANAQNPQQVFMNFAKNNPNLQPILQSLQNGSNPQQLFYSLCQQRGIDPQAFLKQLTGNNT